MHTLRYWLGLPLLNLLLILFAVVFPAVMPSQETCGGFFVFAAMYVYAALFSYGGLLVLPLLTGLYYPAGRSDCRPLWIPAVASFFIVGAAWALALALSFAQGGVLSSLAGLPMALAIAAVEIVGYSIGLLIARAIAGRKNRA